MNKEYKVEAPQDFGFVIEDIFNWYKNSGQKNLVIALQGDLGVGKTAFAKELGKYLGIREIINSPTFVIMKQYELDYKSFNLLVHIDAYRIEDEVEVGPLRLGEIFVRPNTIVCIEWPEQISKTVPVAAVRVLLGIGEGEVRKVSVITPD